MAIRVVSEFIRKATVRILVYVYDDDGDLADATSVNISIIDPDGTVVVDGATTDMTWTATGTYEYFYITTTSVVEGDYQIECDIVDSSYHTYVHSQFNLTAGINE